VKALEAIVPVLEVEGEVLKYEAVAVAEIPESVKNVFESERARQRHHNRPLNN